MSKGIMINGSPRKSSPPVSPSKRPWSELNDSKHSLEHGLPNGLPHSSYSIQRNGYSPNKRRKPNGIGHPASVEGTLSSKASRAKSEHAQTKKAAEIQKQRKQLPIALGRESIIREIANNPVTVLVGETGSGKTTQVPQYLLEGGVAGNGMIAVTQPRRVAATSLATRVAEEQDTELGERVGYAVRFDEKSSSNTRIKYLTDGMIVRELMSDPLLSKYSIIIVDEAHERTLTTDVLMSNLKTILRARNGSAESGTKGKNRADSSNPLRVVIMSATLDAEKFSSFYSNAKVIYVKGRQHPVTVYHTSEGQTDYTESAVRVFFQIHIDRPRGDVLIFLPGQEDIENLAKSIRHFAAQLPADKMEVLICQMYASQAQGENMKVFKPAPPNTRKCILATNIAETSITIPGVKYVIDTGKCKEDRYLSRPLGGGFGTLLTRDISQSSAMQRTGRAGREGEGFCFRLYTEDAFNRMDASTTPEILRCDLTSSLLQLKCLNQDLETLDWLDPPATDSIGTALRNLLLLSAIDPARELTPLGRQMAAFPLAPHHARMIIASQEFGCTREVIDIVSVLSASSKLFVDILEKRDSIAEVRRKFRHESGDHLTILNVVREYGTVHRTESKSVRQDWCKKHFLNEKTLIEAEKIAVQLRQTCERLQIDWRASCAERSEAILQSLGQGLLLSAALLQPDKTFKQTIGHQTIKIHPSSVMHARTPSAIIYDELVYTTSVFARGVSAIPKVYLRDSHRISGPQRVTTKPKEVA